ncbi:MAG: hypothetical protein HOE48_22505 [Candidatus Latescibacteria bacterium]|nr:hypothetical protein [Candidatus Latescibacterota bacterium]
MFVIGQPAGADQQITASWVETQLGGGGSSRTYAGRVAFKDSVKALQIWADSAYVQGTTYIFVANLVFQDSTRKVRARKLTYDNGARVGKFEGNVLLEDEQRALFAQHIHVWPDSDKVLASGEVVLSVMDEDRHIRADELTYRATLNFGTAVGNVVASKKNGTDSLIIEADSLRFVPDEETFDFFGNTVVSQRRTSLFAESGWYRGNILRAIGHPQVFWSRSTQVDSLWAEADTIDAFLKNDILDTLFLTANAKIQLRNQRETDVAKFTLMGDAGFINLAENMLSTLKMNGHVNLGFEQADTFAELPGDSIFVSFKNGKLDSLIVVGASEGTFNAAGKGNSRFLGQKKTLWFLDDRLVRLRLEGHALCHYSSLVEREDGDLDLSGDILDLFFEDNELSQIIAGGNVSGVYLQDDTGSAQ